MAEKLRLDHGLGESRAVERDEGRIGARRQVVQGARHHLLAGAGLADDHHRGIGAGEMADLLAQADHGGGFADEAGRQAAHVAEPAAERAVFQHQPAMAGGAADHRRQHVRIEGLFDEVGGALAHRLHRHRHVAMAGHQDHRQVRVDLLDPPQQLQPAGAGQQHVGDDAAGKVGGKVRERGFRIHRLERIEVCQPHPLAQARAHRRIVVDDEHRRSLGRRGVAIAVDGHAGLLPTPRAPAALTPRRPRRAGARASVPPPRPDGRRPAPPPAAGTG